MTGKLPVVYNGRSVEEWYRLYCQEALKHDRLTRAVEEMFAMRVQVLDDDSECFEAEAVGQVRAVIENEAARSED